MSYAMSFPNNKYQLLKLVQEGYARPIHFTTFYENQAATNFPKYVDDMIYIVGKPKSI